MVFCFSYEIGVLDRLIIKYHIEMLCILKCILNVFKEKQRDESVI